MLQNPMLEPYISKSVLNSSQEQCHTNLRFLFSSFSSVSWVYRTLSWETEDSLIGLRGIWNFEWLTHSLTKNGRFRTSGSTFGSRSTGCRFGSFSEAILQTWSKHEFTKTLFFVTRIAPLDAFIFPCPHQKHCITNVLWTKHAFTSPWAYLHLNFS